MYPIQLSGSQVILREFCPDDLNRLMAVIGDGQVTRSLAFDTRSREQAEEVLDGVLRRANKKPRIEYYLAVTTTDNGLIGFVRLGLGGVQAARLAGAGATAYWGRGYGVDAARTMVDFGFHTLKLHRISAAIGPENTVSIKIARRLGMTCEGRIRDHVYIGGQWRDSLLYSVLVDEWLASEI